MISGQSRLSLTSIYALLLGLNVLLTKCSETFMCGMECRRFIIIDFSKYMMLAYRYADFSSTMYTLIRRHRIKLFFFLYKASIFFFSNLVSQFLIAHFCSSPCNTSTKNYFFLFYLLGR